MNVSFGLKAHSGWAVLVVLGSANDGFELIERRRIELVDEEWAKQPYHAAEELETGEARQVVEKGIGSAEKHAKREIESALNRAQCLGNKVKACGILMGQPMPDWTVEEILAVHFRMHKAEGCLFREALAKATKASDVKLIRVPEKSLDEFAVQELGMPLQKIQNQILTLGKSAGPPWGKDQKEAALAAMIGLRSTIKTSR